MLLCPNCRSDDVSVIQDDEMFCLNCEYKFNDDEEPEYDGPTGPSDDEIAEAVDMQTFEDRMNPCGDD